MEFYGQEREIEAMKMPSVVADDFAIYNGDCVEALDGLPDESVHLSIYSPPFSDLYNYSSSDRDMSNCRSYKEFLEHYAFLVRQLHRLTMPGRMTAVHCMDIPIGYEKGLEDFPGDIIRLHRKIGFWYHARFAIWKEPLRVRNRTMALGLAHKQVVKDACYCGNAGADYLLLFRKRGKNKVPIRHPLGLKRYAGARRPSSDLLSKYADWENPRTNKLSHWIWRQYASSVWDDVRIDHVLPYKESREPEDEKHVCPLQLDVIERAIVMWSNPGEVVLTPFMGVGSEVYVAVKNGRKGIGIELKESYFRQAVRNIRSLEKKEEEPERITL